MESLVAALPEILKLASQESIAILIIVFAFLAALLRITHRALGILQENNHVVADNTTQTARTADALNQIALRMPNFGCSQGKNMSHSSIKEVRDGV